MPRGRYKITMPKKPTGPVRTPFHWAWGQPKADKKGATESKGSTSKAVNKEILPIKACGTKRSQKAAIQAHQRFSSKE